VQPVLDGQYKESMLFTHEKDRRESCYCFGINRQKWSKSPRLFRMCKMEKNIDIITEIPLVDVSSTESSRVLLNWAQIVRSLSRIYNHAYMKYQRKTQRWEIVSKILVAMSGVISILQVGNVDRSLDIVLPFVIAIAILTNMSSGISAIISYLGWPTQIETYLNFHISSESFYTRLYTELMAGLPEATLRKFMDENKEKYEEMVTKRPYISEQDIQYAKEQIRATDRAIEEIV